MPKARPFAYNDKNNPKIDGTIQVGSLAVGAPITGFTNSPQFWNGPDEEQGYVIAIPVPDNTQPTPVKLTLSQTYRGTDVILSNGNQTANQLFGYNQSVLGTTLIGATDKVMFSVLVNLSEPATQTDSHFIGIGYTSMNYQGNPYGGFPGNDDQSVGYGSDGKIWYNGTVIGPGMEFWGDGDRIDIVIDNNNNAMWVRKNGSSWNNDSNSNPETNTGGIEIIGGPFYPVLCPGYEGRMIIQNTAIYGVPTGFTFIDMLTASVKFIGTKHQVDPFKDSTFIALVNKYFNQTFSNAVLAGVWLTDNGYWHSYKDGSTPQTAGDNALQIKTNFSASTDGQYWIVNGNINGGIPFLIYADMTTDGGGWTLLVTNQDTQGWTYENSILFHELNPVIDGNYSIVAYADYIKDTGPTFQYMLDAYERGRFGGIWSVPQSYSFVYTANTQTDVTLDIKFGTWEYGSSSIEQIMPYRGGNNSGILTTSYIYNSEWWGTIITNGGWQPAPWISGNCGAEGCMPNPGIIWYWVR